MFNVEYYIKLNQYYIKLNKWKKYNKVSYIYLMLGDIIWLI